MLVALWCTIHQFAVDLPDYKTHGFVARSNATFMRSYATLIRRSPRSAHSSAARIVGGFLVPEHRALWVASSEAIFPAHAIVEVADGSAPTPVMATALHSAEKSASAYTS